MAPGEVPIGQVPAVVVVVVVHVDVEEVAGNGVVVVVVVRGWIQVVATKFGAVERLL